MAETQEAILVEEIRDIVSTSCDTMIVDNEQYELAAEFLIEMKAKLKKVADHYGPLLRATHEAHKEVKSSEKKLTAPLVSAIKTVGAELGLYQDKLEEERRQDVEITRAIEQKAANESAAEIADSVEASGYAETATAIRNGVPRVQPIVKSNAPKVAGTRVARAWKYEIVDESIIPREYLCVDEIAIKAMVKARRGSTSIPGVRVYPKTNVT